MMDFGPVGTLVAMALMVLGCLDVVENIRAGINYVKAFVRIVVVLRWIHEYPVKSWRLRMRVNRRNDG
jgi:hypothetical protein